MKTIKVLGQNDERLKAVEFGKALPEFRVAQAVQFATDRASATYQYIENLQDDDVVELVFEGDIHRWVTVEQLERDYKYSLSRGESPDVIEIPPQLPGVSAPHVSRGATTWVLKALRVLKFDPMEKAAKSFAQAWDEKLMPAPGLYRFADGELKRGDDLQINADKPILLLLHGTFSSTTGRFRTFPREIWPILRQQYGDQIFGYDHRTLSLSPIQNALDLVERLPKHSRLHLVTHSRGGLIGELLSRSGRTDSPDFFDQADLDLAATEGQRAALAELSRLLKINDIRVERFVRIACPTRGTTLASGKIDKWLELVVNVLSKVMEPTTRTLFGVLTDLLLDFKKQINNPEAIPGLEAMVPDSGLIRMVNRAEVEVNTPLCVIAGDIEKSDILGRLAIFFTDLFYFEEHDLVVQTRAMYGGAPRRNGLYFFIKGKNVDHFHYFSGQQTAEKIMEALTHDSDNLHLKGFRKISEAYKGEAIAVKELVRGSYQKRANVSQPVVYVVPGIMGTHLAIDGGRIWLDLFALARGRILNLEIANRKIQPHSLVAMAYGNLVDYLSATHEVIPFPYDWRLSILDEADRFAKEIEAKLEETKQPIRIVAHSMGGLVTRAMINRHPDLWAKICDRHGSRFVMLGTPNKGAYKIPRLICGQESILRMLAMLDVRNSPERLLGVISRFPGVLQLLPMDDELWDFLDANTWKKFSSAGRYPWVKPLQKDLDEAKRFRDVLELRVMTTDDPIVYVAGTAKGAPVGLDLADDGRIIFRGTNEGDGTVTWRSGILPELERRTWYMNAPHGDMANHKESFAAIYELLHEGKTTRLSTVRPRVARGVEDVYILPEESVQIYPAQTELEQTALGASPIALPIPPVQPIKISVAHGNLAFCDSPVAVGHYESDGIYSAERELDHHLSGRLVNRHRLGLYPGPENTAEVILNSKDRKPGGAIIVGLGKAGELSPRKLTQSFANAMRQYAIKAVESDMIGKDGTLAVSTLIIGAGGMGLSVANSVDAILSGVLQANASFSQAEGALHDVRLAEVQFIELFKDQAILAAKALRTYENKPEFTADLLLHNLRGGFQRVVFVQPPGWWTRIYIRTNKDSSLLFTLPTDRARSEESQQGVQRQNIESLISQAVLNPRWDQSQAASMFELMIPNNIKGLFRDLEDVVFVVDPEAAHYPWELLYNRRAGQEKPLVVQVGMIRQFSTASFRERVVDVQNKNILVVGNPANLSDDFADLPGAQQEASLVAGKFKGFGYEVTEVINKGSNTIMNSLFANDYRILHLAGHGVYEYPVEVPDQDKPVRYTGMVLGDGVFLTANEIKNKTDIPELVFINCCHLGKVGSAPRKDNPEFNKLAASLSRELIEMGVKAVIAAGWAVDDSAAITFADVFYDHMLNGATFGDAVKSARRETYELHKDRTNTWAAYQCYGDPSYQLVSMSDGGPKDSDKFVDIEEAKVEIMRLSGQAKTKSAQGLASLRDRLVALQTKIKSVCPEWLEDSTIQESLAEALGEVFWLDEAVTYYRKAINNPRCGASIKAIEQLTNLESRLAVKKWENDPQCFNDSRTTIEAQISKLQSLISTVGETLERRALIGSSYKRLAHIASDKPTKLCEQSLRKMEKAYKEASELDPGDSYPLSNYLVAKVARLLRTDDAEEIREALPELTRLVEQADNLVQADLRNSLDDIWAANGELDIRLIDYVVKCMGEGSQDVGEGVFNDLFERYKATWQRFGSAREINSVLEHYAFLRGVLKGSESRKNLIDLLDKMLSALQSVAA